MLNASYASMEREVKDNRLDLRQFITPLTGMDATEDSAILNSELEYIVRETGQKPMAVVVSLSFPPPTPFWLRHARATVKNKPSNQKIIKRYDAGFWSGTDMQQQFMKVLNLASHMTGVIIGYGDKTYTTQVGKLFTLEDARYDKLLAEPYVVHVKASMMAFVKNILRVGVSFLIRRDSGRRLERRVNRCVSV
ncbi:hypothetical protein WN943_008265 [Citrus x changshan-huyou]